MNPYYKHATRFIEKEVGKDCVIVEESIHDSSDFYGFTYQSAEFLKKGNFEDMLVGQGYNFISKIDNRIFSYGSGYGFEEALTELRMKISQETVIKKTIPGFNIQREYRLKVISFLKKQLLIDTLLKFELTYIIPEVVGSSIFRIPRSYSKKLLVEKISHLPVIFHGLNQDELPEIILELLKNTACEFDIIESEDHNVTNHRDKASKHDLEPLW